MKKPIAVVRFWGTNCDYDVVQALQLTDVPSVEWWFQDQYKPQDVSAIVIPGGFSYGDYLRCGAMAARTPVMKSVAEAAKKGIPILGICNGFQILCEAQLLPGQLLANRQCHFLDQWVDLKVQRSATAWLSPQAARKMRLPIAHGEGRYYVPQDQLKRLQDQNQIWMTYESDVNGSLSQIAGVVSENGQVAALMPHPERAMTGWMGGDDGKFFFQHFRGLK